MGKTKNKKSITSDSLRAKKSTAKPHQTNSPFELHVNKNKFNILGRETKDDRGRPGASRSKAIQQRKKTLGQEYIHRNKNNSFRDKRLGIKDGENQWMNKEEAATARFVAEQLQKFRKSSKKSSLFNLNDDTTLTHKGQTLAEIEQYHDTISDDDADDEELDRLNDEYTEAAHFGGGGARGAKDGGERNRFERKSAIDDLIAETKRRKIEISKEKDEVSELTHKLDVNWRSMIPLLGKLRETDDIKKPKPDDYDRAMREMIFEPRGAVSDKLRSEEEVLKKEKERLDQLEKERRERMEGITKEDKKAKHRSADDLDDSYFLEPVEKIKPTLAYDLTGDTTTTTSDNNDVDSDDDDLEDFTGNNSEKENEPENDAEDDDDNDESSDDDEDNLSDLRSSEDDEQDEVIQINDTEQSINVENGVVTPVAEAAASTSKQTSQADRLKMIKKASAELPYTFDLPDTYEQLEKLLANHNAEYQNVIFERMIKSNHPKLMPENRKKFLTLFAYMMQHINDTFQSTNSTTIEHNFRLLKLLSGHVFDVFNIDPVVNSQCIRDVIIEKHTDFHGQKNYNEYPTLDTFVFLKLISTLFSTSDYRHSVVTPCFLFIGEMLSRCRIENRSDIASGLFLVSIVLEYTKLSKRYLPAALNFLVGVVHLCIEKRPIEMCSDIMLPFQTTGPHSSLLVLSSDYDKKSTFNANDCFLRSSDLIRLKIDNNFRIRCLNSTLRITTDMLKTISDNHCVQYLIAPFDTIYKKLNISHYPAFISESLTECIQLIDGIMKKPIVCVETNRKQPIKSLRMMEPKFDVVYDDKRSHKPLSDNAKSKLVRQGLVRKVKNETRGAIREIRRDNAFLSKLQHKEQMANDAERKEKVRRLFSEASIQQGELNAMDRKKKHL